jgi:hypothetical protein
MISEITSFTTDDHERIDNFGSTGNPEDLYTKAGSAYVNHLATWTAEGATVITMINTNDADPNNDGPSDDGGTSLRIDYNDADGIAKATCVFAKTRDWSSAVKRASMRLQLRGLDTNDPEQITVTVTDTSDVSGSVTLLADDDQIAEVMVEKIWNGFDNVDISIADMAIDHANIKGFSISVGDGSGSDKGTVWIDAIQVYQVRCLPPMVPYYFDNGDCAADVNEVQVIAQKWLLDLTPTTVMAAGSEPLPGPVLYHTFDTGTYTGGDTFTGVANSNVLERKKGSEPAGTHQSTDVKSAGYPATNTHSMLVDSSHRMETSSFTNLPTGSATLSLWVKPDQLTDHLNPDGSIVQQRPFRIKVGGANTYWRLNVPDGDGDVQIAGNGLNGNRGDDVDISALESTWMHIAYVHDYDNKTSAIYLNGVKIDERTDDAEMLPFPDADNMRMPHNAAENGFNGLIDELRIYDYALTHEQVLYLAVVGSVSQPVVGVNMAGDANGDETWNIIDLAELSATYQKDDVWWP